MKNFFVALLLSLYGVITSNALCADVIVDSTTTYACNSPGTFDSSYFATMPANSQVILISGEVRINSYCSGPTDPYHLLGLTIEPAGAAVNIIDLTNSPSQSQLLFRTQDSSGMKSAYGFTPSLSLAQWIGFTFWIDIGTNTASGDFSAPPLNYLVPTSSPSYTSSWTFNASPKLYLCSQPGGTNSLNCDFKNVRVVYSLPTPSDYNSILFQISGGLQAAKVASYAMTQTSGYTVTDSASLGTAYLGSSTAGAADTDSTHMPTWEPFIDPSTNQPNQNQGLTFTASTQYVSVPHFSLPTELQVGSYSIGFRVWLKLPNSLAASGYIFTYSTSDLSTKIFGVQVGTNAKLTVSSYGGTLTGTVALNLGQWNSIIVNLEIADYAYRVDLNTASYIATSVINNAADINGYFVTNTRFSQSNTDVIRIGGPPTVLGTMAGFEIYSPASAFISSGGCSSSTCNRDIGANTLSNSVCALSICSANCLACQNSQASGCLGCNTGYVHFQNQCQLSTSLTCPTGKYLDSSSYVCQNCMTGCDDCTDSSTCITCSSNYILSNDKCVQLQSASSSLSTGGIVGVVIGSVAGVCLVAGLVYAFSKGKLGLKILSRPRAPTVAQISQPKVVSSPVTETANLVP